MIVTEEDRRHRRTRQVMRTAATAFLVASLIMISAEWTMSDAVGGEGRLISAGLVLCVCANLLCVFLMIGRSSEHHD